MELVLTLKNIITLYRHVAYLQSCFDIFVVVFSAPFSWKSLFFLGAVKCGCLINIDVRTERRFSFKKKIS